MKMPHRPQDTPSESHLGYMEHLERWGSIDYEGGEDYFYGRILTPCDSINYYEADTLLELKLEFQRAVEEYIIEEIQNV